MIDFFETAKALKVLNPDLDAETCYLAAIAVGDEVERGEDGLVNARLNDGRELRLNWPGAQRSPAPAPAL